MRGSLLRFIEEIRASFWFIPTLMTVGALLLSLLTVWVDLRGTPDWLAALRFVAMNQPEGARSLLSTIAGSMINVAGVVFSLTMVTLTLASQQYGPRLLGNFMRDRGNQVVLGVFVSTFLYCLLVLRTVRTGGEDDAGFIPHLSITVALLITLVALASLIYFIHHVASSIQVQNVIGRVAHALRNHVAPGEGRTIFPATAGQELATRDPPRMPAPARPVAAKEAGYLQTIDGDALVRLAAKHDAVVRLRVRPGGFVMHGMHVIEVHPPDLSDATVRRMMGTLSFGAGRGQSEDPEAQFDQLLELALRALSPAINNPITANACVDRMCDALLELGRGELPSPYRADDEGALRLVVPPFDLPGLAQRLFSSLRSGAATSLLTAVHVVTRLEQLHEKTDHSELSAAAEHERTELLSASLDAMSGSDYRTLLARSG